jgi:hypothetical protein
MSSTVRRGLIVGAAALLATTGLVAAAASPALADSTTTVSDPTGAARATLTLVPSAQDDSIRYTLTACDTKADGHHAAAYMSWGNNTGQGDDRRVSALNGNGTCTKGTGVVEGCRFAFLLTAENWEGSKLLTESGTKIIGYNIC